MREPYPCKTIETPEPQSGVPRREIAPQVLPKSTGARGTKNENEKATAIISSRLSPLRLIAALVAAFILILIVNHSSMVRSEPHFKISQPKRRVDTAKKRLVK